MIFSVVLCVNSYHEFLGSAINSVLEQDFTHDYEVIVIANNCDDFLFEYLSCMNKDNVFRLYRTSIGQLSFNLNYGVNLSNGDYIVRMDADDISLRDRLINTYNTIINNEADIYSFSADIIDENGVVIKRWNERSTKNIVNNLYYSNRIIHPTVVIKKTSLLSVKGYLGGFQSEDFDLWLRFKRLGYKFHHEEITVLNYRIHSEQSKGSLLPYCECSSYLLREFLITADFRYLIGSVSYSLKRFLKFMNLYK